LSLIDLKKEEVIKEEKRRQKIKEREGSNTNIHALRLALHHSAFAEFGANYTPIAFYDALFQQKG
jgi:hypothetical protein